MDKYLNEDAITAEIMSYVKNRIYNYAVLIDGDWGTGKTYFIQKSIIPTLEGSGYMPIYISLYGVNSTDTVSQKIALSILTNKLPSDKRTVAKQCLPAIGSFVLPIGQTLLNATGISILEPFFKSPVEDIPWDTIFKKFNDSRKRIFIFDDLERCSLPINEILGYINSLVEHESEKVLIVANQQAIGKMSLRNDLEAKYQVVLNPQLHLTEKVRKVSQSYFTSQDKLADQHITEFTPDQLRQHTAELFSENVLYKEIKEKLVGQELYFRPTLEKTLPCIIDESSLDDEVKEVLTQSLDKILNVFQQENCLNLRSFQAALLTLIRIWNLPFDKSINPLDRQQLLEDLFVAILHSTIQQKQNAVEKSAVQVIGYGKTDELKPGQSEQVTVTMDRYMMASYDYTNAKGYILSAGDYYLALGDNAHDALNNILAAKGASGMVDQDGNTVEGNAAKTYRWSYDTLDTESYRYSVTGEEVTNQFDDCDANYWQEGSVTYLTRQDWNGTFPTKAPAITCTEEMMQILQGELYTKPEDSPSVSDITQGQNNGLTFVSMKDVSFDDTETWDKYLDQMTVEELASQISDMFGTPEVSSVAKPAFSEGDGTASVGANTFPEEYGDTRDVCLYPCSVVAACMWNSDRLTRRGELMAEEALYCKLPLFWTGGGNLHRTPFGGRNGEYFSEDAILTNLYTTTELTAVQSRGVTPGIKHVAGNDQEFHREGLAVFFNEQAFREQTLRAFEGALSNENTMALMQSFNRLGLVWSSSSKALCTQVLRKEWGFNGQQETDGVAGGAYKSHFATSLSAGTTTYCIDPTGSAASAIVEEIRGNDDGNMLLNLRDAVKRYHYMLSRTNLINGLSMDATVESIMPWWQIALYAIDVVFVLLMAGSLFMMFRAKRRSEEKA